MWRMFTSQASEFYVAREIKHPHVLRMFDFFLQHRNGEDEFVIVSELCDATLNEIEFSMAAFMDYFLQVSSPFNSSGENCLKWLKWPQMARMAKKDKMARWLIGEN